ncbi:hypothetical protein EJ04DRAFT_576218 [Polyplosphaeria fusca]|uniref:WW domain-containing protein n=1 Tax=Polyplosphaeria fusca TaxID=682080 RepID=A0A9P4V3S0_9PLEO|nr:hypothetical protein EJ04DRAFT_576218 [Polyplosphaeria fusca]
MSTSQPPTDAPPSYADATGSSSTSHAPAQHHLQSTSTTPPPRISTESPANFTARNGIPPAHRRSMEDENRPLPPGWIRQFDPQEQHQFFVDTQSDPPRSIWTHPYDDTTFLSTLTPEERKKHARLHRTMTLDDLAAESSDDESHPKLAPRTAAPPSSGPSSSSSAPQPTGIHKFGRKMKDKVTGSSHEQREAERRRRDEQERQAYAAHMRARQAMVRAMETGMPQWLCKDAQGRDVYIEPPRGPGAPLGAYGYNPYNQGPYMDPNVRFVRPVGPYGRPYGAGYGGGLGVPVAAGFLGGALLGGLLF